MANTLKLVNPYCMLYCSVSQLHFLVIRLRTAGSDPPNNGHRTATPCLATPCGDHHWTDVMPGVIAFDMVFVDVVVFQSVCYSDSEKTCEKVKSGF